MSVIKLNIEIKDLGEHVYREVLVPVNFNFSQLSSLIRILTGRYYFYDYQFVIGEEIFCCNLAGQKSINLFQDKNVAYYSLFCKPNPNFSNDLNCKIVNKGIIKRDLDTPICLEGKGLPNLPYLESRSMEFRNFRQYIEDKDIDKEEIKEVFEGKDIIKKIKQSEFSFIKENQIINEGFKFSDYDERSNEKDITKNKLLAIFNQYDNILSKPCENFKEVVLKQKQILRYKLKFRKKTAANILSKFTSHDKDLYSVLSISMSLGITVEAVKAWIAVSKRENVDDGYTPKYTFKDFCLIVEEDFYWDRVFEKGSDNDSES